MPGWGGRPDDTGPYHLAAGQSLSPGLYHQSPQGHTRDARAPMAVLQDRPQGARKGPPLMPSPAFQANAFQSSGPIAFQTAEVAEVLLDFATQDFLVLRLGPPVHTYPRGSTVVFTLEVRDGSYAPPQLANSG